MKIKKNLVAAVERLAPLNLNVSSPLTSHSFSNRGGDDEDEKDDHVAPSYRNLSIKVPVHDDLDSASQIHATMNSFSVYRSSHHPSLSDSSDESEDDDYEAKCPDKLLKMTRAQRLKAAPYTEAEPYLNAAHHCGGRVMVVNTSTFYQPDSLNCNDFQSCNVVNCTGSWNEDSPVDQLIREFLSKVTCKEEAYLYQLAVKAANSLPDLTDLSEDNQSQGATDNYESGYDSCSPRSSAYSPPSFRISDCEASPLHENEVPSYTFATPNLPRTKSPPLNIPCNKEEPSSQLPPASRTKSLPTTPTSQRRFIRPQPIAVYSETDMVTPAVDRIKSFLNRSILAVESTRVLCDQQFSQWTDEHNETKLMEHVRKVDNPRYFEVLNAMLERIRHEKCVKLLACSNDSGENVLMIAVRHCYQRPLVARYIVDVMTDLGQDPDQVDQYGNSRLIQELVVGGDRYVQVLAELLNAKKPDGHSVFNVNRRNLRHETVLHLAAATHSERLSTLSITKLLVNHNANVAMMDINRLTPIHLAVKQSCNPLLMRALLSSNFAYNARDATDAVGETALHYAAKRHDLPLRQQCEVMKRLVMSGWSLRSENINRITPLALLPDSTTKEMKEALTKK